MRNDVKVTYFSDIIGRFDREAGKIYGVSVITEGKAKGHDLMVDSTTLMEIKDAAENLPDGRLKTKLNHRSGVEAVFGYLENFRVDGPKLLADLRMLKQHKDFEQTFEQIESLPNHIGLSVAFVGKEAHDLNGIKLARCREILSADLVPEPAANPTGMFEVKTEAVVDTEKLINMNEQNDAGANANAGAAAATGGDKEPTMADLMNFLQETLMPRLEATEQFQAAIQAELDAAAAGEGGEGEELKPGDDGNQHHITPVTGSTADGGTRAGAPSSPSNQGALVGAGAAGAAGAETFSQVRDAVIMLERRINAKEEAERETQLENALSVIKAKTEGLTEYAENLQQENVVLLEALRTGVRPVHVAPNEIFKGGEKPTDFQSRVTAYVEAGKSKTEAVMLARKDDPGAHVTWLANQGVVTNL